MRPTLLRSGLQCLSVCVFLLASAPAQDQHWLETHLKGNRYEGFLDRPNARHSFELLGFYAFRQKIEDNPSALLHVAFYLPKDAPVFLDAQEIQNHSQYHMKAIDRSIVRHDQDWSYFNGWPVGDVLLPNRISLSNLGVVIRLKSDNEFARDLAPAVLYAGPQPNTLPRNITLDTYSMYLLINKPLASLTYQIVGPSGLLRTCAVNPYAPHSCTKNETAAPVAVSSGSVVKLEFARAGLQSKTHVPAEITLRILGHVANSAETVQAEFAFEDADLPSS